MSSPATPSDPADDITRRLLAEQTCILEHQRGILRAHYRIGLLALEARALAATAAGSALARCAASIGHSRQWLARHAHAAMRVGGSHVFERLAERRTAAGGVLSPKQYLQYGALRSGEARRAWRLRLYGESNADKIQSTSDVRKCAVGTFDGSATGDD
jgi:hypothetical protein